MLCAPLTTRAGALGFLEVYRATPAPFSDDEFFVVSVLAVEMAAALENARLYEALREREERLTEYAAKLVNSQEDERRRISRDIHDGLGQMIVSAFQYLQAHEYSLPEGHPARRLQARPGRAAGVHRRDAPRDERPAPLHPGRLRPGGGAAAAARRGGGRGRLDRLVRGRWRGDAPVARRWRRRSSAWCRRR